MKNWITTGLGLFIVVATIGTAADELVLKPVKIAPDMYAVIGDLGAPTFENYGQNANLGFIVTTEGVVAINSGANVLVAKAFHTAIQSVTKQPVKYLINVNSRPHYWLGNAYFKALNIPIIAHKEADRLMQNTGLMALSSAKQTYKERADGTELAYATELMDDKREITLGNLTIQVLSFGTAHSPGDVVVWIPSRKVLFAGDLVFTDRLLGVLPNGSSNGWVKAFDAAMALKPAIIAPGHGKSTTLKQAKTDTRDYLAHLRSNALIILKQGGSGQDAADKIDQSQFKHLPMFETWARRNASQVFSEIEQEMF